MAGRRGLASLSNLAQMPASFINYPEHWRARAEEMRRLAEDLKDAATKEMMLSRCGPKNGQSSHRG